jgi:tetratricopeptide (TPR) repeat protein
VAVNGAAVVGAASKLSMKSIFKVLCLICLCSFNVFAQTCFETSQEIAPQLPKDTRRDFENKLAEAKSRFAANPKDVESLIWLGRRTAYLGAYKEAIRIYTKGIETFPSDARLYRHRGHRFITLRCFDLAVRDFKQAVKLVKGKADLTEPDGLPNARNVPTSTLQSNIWYHLGLAYYLKGDFKNALKSYQAAEKVSINPDMQVATTHWLYMTLRRLGREKEAGKVIATIRPDLDVIENDDYYKLIKLYQGRLKATDLLDQIGTKATTLSNASIGYGLGNWFLYNGQRAEAENIFRQINVGNQWASFGYIAAEAELKR